VNDAVRIEVDHLTDPLAKPLVLTDSGWLSYSITQDLNSPTDDFRVVLDPSAPELIKWFRRPGHTVRIYCDGNLQLKGIVESCPLDASEDGLQLRLIGRDYGCLLVDDTAPMLTYANSTLRRLAELLIQKHSARITEVIADNAANRHKICGRPVGAPANLKRDSPLYDKALQKAQRGKGRSSAYYRGVDTERAYQTRNEPGETIWDSLRFLASQIGRLVWMSATGQLVLGLPDYWQESPYQPLYVRVDDRMNVIGSNCTMTHEPDIADRRSTYAVTGQGRPSANAVGKDVGDKYAVAHDPAPAFWINDGGALQERLHKTETLTARNIQDKLMVRRLARRKLELSLVKSGEIKARVDGHRQSQETPLWACDTSVDVEFGPRNIKAPFHVWKRTLTYDANGRTTELGLIPSGFWYGYDHNTYDDASYLSDLVRRYERYAL
jgi:prophage tail gpP-like protein